MTFYFMHKFQLMHNFIKKIFKHPIYEVVYNTYSTLLIVSFGLAFFSAFDFIEHFTLTPCYVNPYDHND